MTCRSSTDVAAEVEKHLSLKLWDVARNWDHDLERRVARIDLSAARVEPVAESEVFVALAGMRARSVGGHGPGLGGPLAESCR